MGGMETPLQLILADMTRAFFEGFRLYEKVWEVRNGLIYLKKLAPRDAKTITLQKDEHGDFKGAVQRVSFAGQYHEVIIEGYKTLLYTFQKQKDWLYGRSVLKSAYYHYDKKHKLYYISHKAAELQTVPPKIIKLEQSMDESQKSKLENAVDKLGVNTRVTIPAGVTLESFESKGSPTVSIKDLIDHHNSQMLKSIMAQFMNLGAESNSKGSFALSQTQADYFTMFLESEMRNIASHINWYVIPQLIDWNFGTGVYPQIKFNPIKDSTKDLLQEVFKSLITGKSSSIPDVFYESIFNKTSENLNLGISEEEITSGMAEKKQEVMDAEKQKQDNLTAGLKSKQVNNKQIVKKTAKLADMPVDEHGRPLRESEKNINLSEIEDVMDKAEADMKAKSKHIPKTRDPR
jgi:hypothetical protein